MNRPEPTPSPMREPIVNHYESALAVIVCLASFLTVIAAFIYAI